MLKLQTGFGQTGEKLLNSAFLSWLASHLSIYRVYDFGGSLKYTWSDYSELENALLVSQILRASQDLGSLPMRKLLLIQSSDTMEL